MITQFGRCQERGQQLNHIKIGVSPEAARDPSEPLPLFLRCFRQFACARAKHTNVKTELEIETRSRNEQHTWRGGSDERQAKRQLLYRNLTPINSGDVFGGLGRKILTPYPTTARGLKCCFQTPCSFSIAKTQQIIPCLPHFLLLNEHSSRPDEL